MKVETFLKDGPLGIQTEMMEGRAPAIVATPTKGTIFPWSRFCQTANSLRSAWIAQMTAFSKDQRQYLEPL